MISILFLTILTPLTIYAIALLIHVYTTQPRTDKYLRDRKGQFMKHKPTMYVVDYKNTWIGHEPVYKRVCIQS